MLCKKCKRNYRMIGSTALVRFERKKDSRRAISQRKDGTYQKAITIDGKRKYFTGDQKRMS